MMHFQMRRWFHHSLRESIARRSSVGGDWSAGNHLSGLDHPEQYPGVGLQRIANRHTYSTGQIKIQREYVDAYKTGSGLCLI